MKCTPSGASLVVATLLLLQAPEARADSLAGPEAGRTSEAAAYAWALGGSLLPFGAGLLLLTASPNASEFPLFLMAAGPVVGPSLGQYYAGSPWQATAGLTARGTGFLLMGVGLSRGLENRSCWHLRNLGDEGECPDTRAGPVFLAGFLTYLGGAVYSLVDTHFAVARSRAAPHPRAATFGVSPTLGASTDGTWGPGATAWLRF